MTDSKFLKQVQRAGWGIQAVTEDSCIARCPTNGCSLRILLKPEKPIPDRFVSEGPSLDIELMGWAHSRGLLKDRREELGLTIREVEAVSGIADDHIAKMEPHTSKRLPNVDTFMEWAAALGYQVLLRPVALPPITLAMIEETRPSYADRQRRFAIERQRDGRQPSQDTDRAKRAGR